MSMQKYGFFGIIRWYVKLVFCNPIWYTKNEIRQMKIILKCTFRLCNLTYKEFTGPWGFFADVKPPLSGRQKREQRTHLSGDRL